MKIALFGANGRVGSRTAYWAEKLGHTVIPIEKDFVVNEGADVAIDFSLPQATSRVCEYCKTHHCPLVTGVTGRNAAQQAEIDKLQTELPVVAKANFSQGVKTLLAIAEYVGGALPNWDCEVVEIHRRDKKDSPSGTAKEIAAKVAENKNFKKVTIHSLRCGSNFGCHTVIFAADGESLTVTHQAENVDIFARGAIREAELLLLAQNVADAQAVGAIDGE